MLFTEAEIARTAERGVVPEEALVLGWHPSAVREVVPTPEDDEVVSFLFFHWLGLGLPLHRFARGLLFFYGLRLHDLMPEGILHIATFITLCEVFLRIEPHFMLWRWVFEVVPLTPGDAFPAFGGPESGCDHVLPAGTSPQSSAGQQ